MILPALLDRSFRRAQWLLLALTVVLVVFQLVVVFAARNLRETGAFREIIAAMPVFIQQLVGPALVSFGSMVGFGYFHPVVIIVFVGTAIIIASEPAADVESGVVDLVLARPVARWQLVARSVIMTAMTTTLIAGLMVMSSRISTRLLAAPSAGPDMRVLAALAANLVAVAWIMGALSLALASLVPRRGAAAGAAGIVALVLYLLNLLGEMWQALRPYRKLSPFYYYQPTAILAGVDQQWMTDMATLVAGAAILCAVAFAAFSRRDV